LWAKKLQHILTKMDLVLSCAIFAAKLVIVATVIFVPTLDD
jgi:hypothetical protein